MQTIFEVFDCVTGKTEGWRHGEAKARETCDRLEKAGVIRDFLPASGEGFYVVDMRGFVKAGPWADSREAIKVRDFENMATDNNSFSVVEHRLS